MHSWICKVYEKFVFGFEGAAIGCSPECNELQECLFLLVGNFYHDSASGSTNPHWT